MHTVTKQVEITIHTPNEPALLGRLTAITDSCGAEVLASCSYWDHAGAVMMLVAADPRRMTRALEAKGFKCKSNSVLLVETAGTPGLAAALGTRLANAGVGVLYSYSFRSEHGQSYVVFKTADDSRAVHLLEMDALGHDQTAAAPWQPPVESGLLEEHAMIPAT